MLKAIKGNYSLFQLIRVFIVELFDVVANGEKKCFKWELSTLVVCWPQKQNKQTNKTQSNNNKGGGGGEGEVQM